MSAQIPEQHISISVSQVLPQTPQLSGSLFRSVHWPSQFAVLLPGTPMQEWQDPAEQTWPSGQALPHEPQLAASVWVSVQTSGH
jgi:hypothetical protein